MEEKDIYSELSSIRNLMERSSKFISLSGLSGVMAGVYALIGAFITYQIVYPTHVGFQNRQFYVTDNEVIFPLFAIAVAVLFLSILTGIWLTIRQAKKKGEKFWNPVSRRLLTNLAIPLFTGGIFILIQILHQNYGIVASACLIFYGLSLISGSQYTFSDVKWLGFCELILGLAAAFVPGYGLLFWALGFGVLHIIYGAIMHFKYKQ